MTPDQIRRSWDDDDTPRSVFPEPLAERLTRENKELRRWKAEAAEVILGLQDLGKALGIPLGERITGPVAVEAAQRLRADNERLTSPACSECGGLPVTCAAAPVKCCPDCSGPTHQALTAGRREPRHDALEADLRRLADKPVNRDDVVRLVPPLSVNGRADTYVSQHVLRAVLDKHAGEQP